LFRRLQIDCVGGHLESRSKDSADRIFPAAGRRSNGLLKIALFCDLLGIAGGISALSLEMRRSPKFFCSWAKFQIFS